MTVNLTSFSIGVTGGRTGVENTNVERGETKED